SRGVQLPREQRSAGPRRVGQGNRSPRRDGAMARCDGRAVRRFRRGPDRAASPRRRCPVTDRFEPRPSLRGGHRMTLYGWGNPRHFPRLPTATRRYFDVAATTRVMAACHWQPRPWEHLTLLALHGLNGSSEAHYMRGLAAKAFARGMNVIRLNQRNCGDT